MCRLGICWGIGRVSVGHTTTFLSITRFWAHKLQSYGVLQTAWILKLRPMHNQNRKIVSRGAAAVLSVEDEEGAISVGEPLAYNPTCVRRVGRHIPACDLLRQAFARPAGRGRRRAGRTWRRCVGDCLLANCQDFPPNGPVFGLRQSRHCRVEVPAPLPGIHI